MTNQTEKVDALQNRAFWHWEYLRRNPRYLTYDYFFSSYFDHLEHIEELDSFYKLQLEPHVSKGRCKFDIATYSYFYDKYGYGEAQTYMQYFLLTQLFARQVRTPYIPASFGPSSSILVSMVFSEKPVSFKIQHPLVALTLSSLREEWLINVNGDSPTIHNFIDFYSNDVGTLELNKKIMMRSPQDLISEKTFSEIVSQISKYFTSEEFQKLCGLTAQLLYNKEHINTIPKQAQNEITKSLYNACKSDGFNIHYESLYDLFLLNKGLRKADEMRLVSLYIWDFVYQFENDKRFEVVGDCDEQERKMALFGVVLEKIQQQFVDKGLTDDPWDQVFRNARMEKYFLKTCECIEKGQILPLR